MTKGARDNRCRSGINPLFRSASVAHGTRAIGAVFTGILDDGTAGLMAIKRCGGVTVVQRSRRCSLFGNAQRARQCRRRLRMPVAEIGRCSPNWSQVHPDEVDVRPPITTGVMTRLLNEVTTEQQ